MEPLMRMRYGVKGRYIYIYIYNQSNYKDHKSRLFLYEASNTMSRYQNDCLWQANQSKNKLINYSTCIIPTPSKSTTM